MKTNYKVNNTKGSKHDEVVAPAVKGYGDDWWNRGGEMTDAKWAEWLTD